jgi:hypothetical protein
MNAIKDMKRTKHKLGNDRSEGYFTIEPLASHHG